MYAIYGSSSPLVVQPPSLDEYLQFQAWREEKRQYQVYQQRILQMERQRQRQRLAAALEQQRHEEEQRRKQQRSLDQRRMMAYLEHVRQQQELKRQRELKRQQELKQQQRKAREQEMIREKLMQQLYWQTQQQQQQEEDDDDDDMDLTDVMESLMTRLFQGDAMDGDDDLDTVGSAANEDTDSGDDSDADEQLMVLTDDTPNNGITSGKQQQNAESESESDSDSDDELVMILTDDTTTADNDDILVTDTSMVDNNKQALKLATLKKIKEQLDNIHASHQRILASSLYFDDTNDTHQKQHDDDTIQLPTISKNHDFLQYEDNIMRILLQLDDISSEGDDLIRQKRKDLVKQAGFILDQLDQHKQSEWERHSSATASSVGSESEDNNNDDDDDGDDSNNNTDYDTTDTIDEPADQLILADVLTLDDDKDSLVTNHKDKDLAYELMQDVDGNGFLILNL